MNSKTIIDFSESETYLLEKLTKHRTAVLATCGNDMQVTARAICIVNDGLNIWFQTDSRFSKTQQMRENPRVALSFENIQIEGVVHEMGHASLESNKWFCKEFSKVHPDSYNDYTNTKFERIFRIDPILITMWRYLHPQTFRDIMDVRKKCVYRELYSAE